MHEKENIIRMKTAEGVELIFEPGLDACLFHSDRNRLSQLLINLLTNAAKFTAKGSIRFGYRTEGSRLRFYVSDTAAAFRPKGSGGFSTGSSNSTPSNRARDSGFRSAKASSNISAERSA